jgi:hypothetical protein
MESPTGIIPENLMFPWAKDKVISFLIAQPLPSANKRRLLAGWANTVGVWPTPLDYHQVVFSGIDNTLPLGAVK